MNDPGGFNTGLDIILKDKETGKEITSGEWYSETGGGSLGGTDCMEGIAADNTVIQAYADGYAPVAFAYELPKNKIATIEVLMQKPCTGAPSCLDNIRTYASAYSHGNKTLEEETIKEESDEYYAKINETFDLQASDYSLNCMECNLGRGGYIRANGTYKDGTPLVLYYHWGWCSSGGTDCGWSACLKTENDQVLGNAENTLCPKLESYDRQEKYMKDYVTMETTRDETNQTQADCFKRGYETVQGKEKTLSIVQNADKYTSTVEKKCEGM